MALGRNAGHFRVDGRRIELIGVLEGFGLAAKRPGIGDLNVVEIIRIEAEDGDAAVGEQLRARNRVLDFLAVRFGNDAHGDVREIVAVVADHGRKRRDLIGVHHDLAEMALHDVVGVRARGAAHGECGCRNGERHACAQDGVLKLHGIFLKKLPDGGAHQNCANLMAMTQSRKEPLFASTHASTRAVKDLGWSPSIFMNDAAGKRCACFKRHG